MRYRWAVLAAGTVAQASFSASTVGLGVMAPVLREEYGLSLAQVGALLSAAWVGACVTLLPWGLAADRYGERLVLTLGLAGSAVCLVGAADAGSFGVLFGLLVLAGAAGASVNSASGRAVMFWFSPSERGLALGIRQTAVPLGALLVAIVVPPLAAEGGSEAAFLFLAGLSAVGAAAGGLVLRDRAVDEIELELEPVVRALRDRRIWRLSFVSALYGYPQVAIIGFGVLFLHDEHALDDADAALVIGLALILGVASRIGAGRWSDVLGSRIAPLRQLGLAIAVAIVVTALLAGGPLGLLVASVAISGGLSMAWNGLAFTAVAELAGAARSGAAIGLQQTVLSASGMIGPPVFAATVSAGSWSAAFVIAALFPVAGSLMLRPVSGH
ncbi:MAG TPA: MFS transporter [Gaiellaceae bacterium]|nr:MFS transporter [Gaiellaceae bacterium]